VCADKSRKGLHLCIYVRYHVVVVCAYLYCILAKAAFEVLVSSRRHVDVTLACMLQSEYLRFEFVAIAGREFFQSINYDENS